MFVTLFSVVIMMIMMFQQLSATASFRGLEASANSEAEGTEEVKSFAELEELSHESEKQRALSITDVSDQFAGFGDLFPYSPVGVVKPNALAGRWYQVYGSLFSVANNAYCATVVNNGITWLMIIPSSIIVIYCPFWSGL